MRNVNVYCRLIEYLSQPSLAVGAVLFLLPLDL